MTREIKFRGKRVDNGEWVYGFLVLTNLIRMNEPILYNEEYVCDNWLEYKVNPATVGQYTGLQDRNGVDIYEGDITKQDAWEDQPDGSRILSDTYRYDKEKVVVYNAKSPFCGFSIHSRVKVIGNIHDNPELLEVKQ